MNDVLSGLVPVMFSPASSVLPHINSGKLVALATTSNRRTPLIAVPTLEEAGVANFNVSLWFGILAPKGTDSQIVNKLSNAIVKALDDPETKKLLAAQTMDIVKGDPVEFKVFINSEITKWGGLIKSNKIDLNQ
jgi:tripartite-type tricarboxylate transporter receptor subunit TctC